MEYKLICIDMDGTLLNGHGHISDRNKSVLKKVIDKGIKVAITTGRIFASADYFANLLGIKAEVISCNGAYVKNRSNNEVVYINTLSKEQVLKIHNVVSGQGFEVIYYTDDTVITETPFPKEHTYNFTNSLVSEEKRVKFFLTNDINEMLDKFGDSIIKVVCLDRSNNTESLFNSKKEVLKFSDLETVSSGSNNFEVMQKGVSKGNAVKIIGEKIGIKEEEIVCIGDNENDVSMLKYAGLGVAMGNGSDVVKKVADYVTDTNVNDGVAKAIEKFVL